MRRAAPRLIDGAITPAFDSMDERVSSYADWVFGWLSSLFTAWDLAYVGSTEAAHEIANGQMPDTVSLHDRLVNVVIEQFESTVVLPDKTGPALDAAWRRTVDRLLRLDRELAADRRARIERVAAYRGEDPGAVLDRYGAPMLAATIANAPPPANLFDRAMLDVHANAGGTTDPVLIR